MTRDEFIKQVEGLKRQYNSYDNNSWEKNQGYDICKQDVLKLCKNLDMDNMTIESFEVFNRMAKELSMVYDKNLDLQRKCFSVDELKLEYEQTLLTRDEQISIKDNMVTQLMHQIEYARAKKPDIFEGYEPLVLDTK